MVDRENKVKYKICDQCGYSTSKIFVKYCHSQYFYKCVICNSDFIRECKANTPQTCSKSCSSRLVRLNTGKKNVVKCEICEESFQGQSANSKYCNKIIIVNCNGFDSDFERKCNNENGSYCSTSCRNKYMRKNLYKINFTKKCKNCGNEFYPTTSGQRFCDNNHYRKCEYCEDDYIVKNNTNKYNNSKFCSNSCSTFSQMDSQFDKNLLHDYRNINEWAKNFKKENKRKPKLADFLIYFNLQKIPSYADRSLFSRSIDSKIELIVLYYLKYIGLHTNIIRRYRRRINGKLLEIDIFFPEYNFGFEIQDFATHCKEKSENLSKFGSPMKDERYHNMKKDYFKSVGINIYELWEDEIYDKSFQSIVDEVCKNIPKDNKCKVS